MYRVADDLAAREAGRQLPPELGARLTSTKRRVAEIGRSADQGGAAGAPAAGLRLGEPRPAQARRRRSAREINHAHPASRAVLHESSPSLPIVQLAATASMAALRAVARAFGYADH